MTNVRAERDVAHHSLGSMVGLPPATRGPIAAALLTVFIGALDLTVIATILPRMIFDLGINTADIDRYIWVVNAYLLAYLIAIPIMGRVSDLIGRGLAFQLALLVFLVGSIWCAVADGLAPLIIGRAIQGAGGGALLPVTMALVGDLLPPGRRVAALGLVGAVDTLGWVLGPLWGAAVVSIAGGEEPWRWVFYVNIPLCILAGVGIQSTARKLPRVNRSPESRRLDLLGALLLGVALLLLNLGLSSGGELGVDRRRHAGAWRHAEPARRLPRAAARRIGRRWSDFHLVGNSGRRPDPAARALPQVAVLGCNRGKFSHRCGVDGGHGQCAGRCRPAGRVRQGQRHLGPDAGAVYLADGRAVLFGGVIVGQFGERSTAVAGLLLVAAGYFLVWLGLRDEVLAWMVPGLIMAGGGFGLLIAPLGASAIESAPDADRGIAAALSLVFRLLGMTIGISVLTALGVSRLQTLTGRLTTPRQEEGESTAGFLVRQQQFITDHAIPLAVQVIRETFLVAALLALVALLPVYFLRSRDATKSLASAP